MPRYSFLHAIVSKVRIVLIGMFVLACNMNVHKRCQKNIANNCGINTKEMAEILNSIGVNTKINQRKKKVKRSFKRHFLYII